DAVRVIQHDHGVRAEAVDEQGQGGVAGQMLRGVRWAVDEQQVDVVQVFKLRGVVPQPGLTADLDGLERRVSYRDHVAQVVPLDGGAGLVGELGEVVKGDDAPAVFLHDVARDDAGQPAADLDDQPGAALLYQPDDLGGEVRRDVP